MLKTRYFILFLLSGLPLHARFFEIEPGQAQVEENLAVIQRRQSRKYHEVGTPEANLPAQPYMTVPVRVQSDMPAGKVFVKAYFFNEARRLLCPPVTPQPVVFEGESGAYPLPPYLDGEKPVKVTFLLPEVLKSEPQWRAVVVFGDGKDATARLITPPARMASGGVLGEYDFPEKAKCLKPSVGRPKASARLTEIRCHTGLPDYPRFTLFARLPHGVKTGREAKGVLCLSLLANSLEQVRYNLTNRRAEGHVADMLRYADKNDLIVVCWGARRLWDAGKNWDELTPDEARAADKRFDRVAAAWEGGIKRLSDAYGFAPKDFLIWGYSASAQYAKRLVLRKPGYFRAVYLHIPSSFDEPTPEASKVLWCLTTGEQESGYERSMKFVQACRKLGYPMVYKAVPYLGHTDHTPSRVLGLQWFEYARSLPGDSQARVKRVKEDREKAPFIADYLNQMLEPADKSDWMPKNLRLPMPTPMLARAWVMNPDNPAPDPSPPVAALTADAADEEGDVIDVSPAAPAAAKGEVRYVALPGLPSFVIPAEDAPSLAVAAAGGATPEKPVAKDAWGDFLKESALATRMRGLGMAWKAPEVPAFPVPEAHREAVAKLCEQAEKGYATELRLAETMRAAGQSWATPVRPALLVARDRAEGRTPPPAPVLPPEPAKPVVVPAVPAKPADPNNTLFGRRIPKTAEPKVPEGAR